MERNYLKRQLILRLVIYTVAAILLYGISAYVHSDVPGLARRTPRKSFFAFSEGKNAHLTPQKNTEPVYMLILTKPPMFISYDTARRTAVVNNLPYSRKAPSVGEILKKAKLSEDKVILIDMGQTSRIDFWDTFKNNLSDWRKKPYIIFQYIYSYIKLRYSGKTDLSVGDFILISTELSTLQPTDFIRKNTLADKVIKGKKRKEPNFSITTSIKINENSERPLVVEIFNASGKNGLAGKVTKFLRDLTNQGIINVDIFEVGTYTVERRIETADKKYKTERHMEILAKTQILDHTARLTDIKKTAYQLGLENHEIFFQQDKDAVSDVKIILGKDFVLPKHSK